MVSMLWRLVHSAGGACLVAWCGHGDLMLAFETILLPTNAGPGTCSSMSVSSGDAAGAAASCCPTFGVCAAAGIPAAATAALPLAWLCGSCAAVPASAAELTPFHSCSPFSCSAEPLAPALEQNENNAPCCLYLLADLDVQSRPVNLISAEAFACFVRQQHQPWSVSGCACSLPLPASTGSTPSAVKPLLGVALLGERAHLPNDDEMLSNYRLDLDTISMLCQQMQCWKPGSDESCRLQTG